MLGSRAGCVGVVLVVEEVLNVLHIDLALLVLQPLLPTLEQIPSGLLLAEAGLVAPVGGLGGVVVDGVRLALRRHLLASAQLVRVELGGRGFLVLLLLLAGAQLDQVRA